MQWCLIIRDFAMASPPPIHRRRTTPLADLVAPVLGQALARRGFGEADLILHWEEIVGARLAENSEPIKLQWPPRGPRFAPVGAAEPATLIIRVEGAFALELQHLAPLVMERVNSHLGWRCVGKLALRQGPLERATRGARPAKAPDAGARAAAERAVGEVEDVGLREALVRLGSGVLSATADGSPSAKS
jgi:hypothetical protein